MPENGWSKWDVVIVGSGGGSLVLALALAEKGMHVAILERQFSPTASPRGEIVQPNGLRILDRLGLLPSLLKSDVFRNDRVEFYRAGKDHLCTVDYRTLPPPYDYSLILLPAVVQGLLLARAAEFKEIKIFWGALFKSLVRSGGAVAGVEAEWRGEKVTLKAPVVVGGDGIQSAVRTALKIETRVTRYLDGYLTAVVDRPPGLLNASHYYLGERKIFGAFPVSSDKLYLFYMVPSDRLQPLQAGGLDSFKTDLLSIHAGLRPFLDGPLKKVADWNAFSFMPCFKVRCERWVSNGAALIGDAAHAMNPHVAQGRNAAMEDGMLLAEVLEGCFKTGDFSERALAAYESARRPKVETLQRWGDEMTWLWNSGWPPLVWCRDRIFRSIHLSPDLHDKILGTVAGLTSRRFHFYDRFRALHLWGPLPKSERLPSSPS